MTLFNKYKQSNTLRWFFLGIGILAVIALTGMNIYSLYALRESTIVSAKENRKFQLEEFTNKVRYRFYRPFRGISKLDMNDLEDSWEASGNFPVHFQNVLMDALEDSLFSDIYYTPDYLDGCYNEEHPIYRFDRFSGLFTIAQGPPKEVCDGFGISKSRMNTIALEEFRWNNKVAFDAHRTMTLALINLDDRNLVGHINFVIDQEHLLYSIMEPELLSKFGDTEQSGMVVWLRDWMQDDILLYSNSDYQFSREKVDMRQRFPDLLDNWVLQASFLHSPAVAATNASLTRNLIVLGFAVFVLFGALVFMFINAQREREFAQRQAGFLANVTHELKTPLAVMQAAGENISDGRVTDGERLKGYGEHIYDEAIRLRKMIDKLLDVARADSGQTLIKKTPLNIDHVLKEYYQKNKAYVESKGFLFEFHPDKNSPLIMVDPDHLETMLNNLVENSIKYSDDRKEIKLGLKTDGSDVVISVADKGTGIPKKAQKKIFDKFYRVENSMTPNTKGHGLGLSIVKNMVEQNGGTIEVNSVVGDGSIFTITFPALLASTGSRQDKSEQKPVKIPDRIELEQYAGQ
jgi:signal transduction histidine kinase